MIQAAKIGRHTSCIAFLRPKKAVKLPEKTQPSGTQIRFIELVHETSAKFRWKSSSTVLVAFSLSCSAGIKTVGKPKVIPNAVWKVTR